MSPAIASASVLADRRRPVQSSPIQSVQLQKVYINAQTKYSDRRNNLISLPLPPSNALLPNCIVCQVADQESQVVAHGYILPRIVCLEAQRSLCPPPQITAMQSSLCHYHYPFTTLHHTSSLRPEDAPRTASPGEAPCRHNLVMFAAEPRTRASPSVSHAISRLGLRGQPAEAAVLETADDRNSTCQTGHGLCAPMCCCLC